MLRDAASLTRFISGFLENPGAAHSVDSYCRSLRPATTTYCWRARSCKEPNTSAEEIGAQIAPRQPRTSPDLHLATPRHDGHHSDTVCRRVRLLSPPPRAREGRATAAPRRPRRHLHRADPCPPSRRLVCASRPVRLATPHVHRPPSLVFVPPLAHPASLLALACAQGRRAQAHSACVLRQEHRALLTIRPSQFSSCATRHQNTCVFRPAT
jgi:hypothetical protein